MVWPKGGPRLEADKKWISEGGKAAWTEERKRQYSERLKGQRLAYEVVTKKRKPHKKPGFAGANNPQWKGGTKPEDTLVTSLEYKLWRSSVVKRDENTCQHCGDRTREDHIVILHTHHIKSFAEFPDLGLEVSNGVILCEFCHRKSDHYGVDRKAK